MQESIDLTQQDSIDGLVERITFRNEQNGYTVASVKCGDETVTVVGSLPFLSEGESAVFYGAFIVHPTYGKQFKADVFERKPPQDAGAILRYLSTGVIRGVGPSTAGKIVEKFGAESLDVIQNHPEQLATIRGISLQKALDISKEYEKQYGVRDIMLMLSKYGVTPDVCLNIYRRFGLQSTELIRQNPYVLCTEGIDLHFESVEEIAADLNIEPENEMRVSAGLEYVLRANLSNGHTCLPREKLIEVACKLLECSSETAEKCCRQLMESLRLNMRVIEDREFISFPEYYQAEEYISARLCAVKRHIDSTVKVADLEIEYIENKMGIRFEDLQRSAIKEAFENGVLILTGGPGTGKTTTLNAIISLFESRNFAIELAAPTGRAAKRMTELTGRDAKTVHRLLEVEWGEGDKQVFARNEKNPLNCDVIIIDETSMIDVMLFESLLRALRLSCRIILVGDSDQLPSIGAGNILNDILSSEMFPSIRLKKVFRQSGNSMIVTNAHSIINSEEPDFSKKDSDCFFLKRTNRQDVAETVVELCCERLIAAYGFNPFTDIQVLCPSRMFDIGTVNFNNLLQQRLNPKKKGGAELFFKNYYIRIGDKVMQTKNNYDLQWTRDDGEFGTGVFNGDVGFVSDIDLRGGVVKVRYDDRVATYFVEDLSQLELAYAITVHKSQGSEFECVILPLFDVPSKLRYRNLLYTAVTRAKKLLVVVGSEAVWQSMAANDKKTLRYTMLKDFLDENKKYTGA